MPFKFRQRYPFIGLPNTSGMHMCSNKSLRIWRHSGTGEDYLNYVRNGLVLVKITIFGIRGYLFI
jgi:hypothetical protein